MKFSVLIPVYKKEKLEYFQQAMQSIWDDQTRKPDQIVLVKDGPLTLELNTLVDAWQQKLFEILTIVALPQHGGLGAALNAGLAHCSHELVARMDTDDISLPQRFEKQLACFTHNPHIDLLGCFVTEIDDNENKMQTRKMPTNHQNIYDNLFACPFIHPTVVFKKKSLLAVGGYDARLVRRQDYDLWFRMAKNGARLANIPESLLLYRFTRSTHSRQSPKQVFSQALIGYNGVRSLKQPYWKALVCFVPFFRSLLPINLQHYVYGVFKCFDPRQKEKKG